MLQDSDKQQIQERFKELTEPVELVLFTQKVMGQCQYCTETETLLKEVSLLSGKLSLKIFNFVTDEEEKKQFEPAMIPATFLHTGGENRFAFYGIPSGYEFATLMEMIIKLSSGESGLSQDSLNKLTVIDKPVHIQVFVTPTCPYCPQAAILGMQAAMVNQNIRTDIIEISEFPYLGQKYGVMGVPKVVMNETVSFDGALPEPMFIEKIVEAGQKNEVD